jgi:hypothetical protein
VLFFLVADMIAAPEHQECILATVMDDITCKTTSTPDARHRTYPEGHQTRPPQLLPRQTARRPGHDQAGQPAPARSMISLRRAAIVR